MFKKILSVLLCLVMLLSFAACGDSGKSLELEKDDNSSAAAPVTYINSLTGEDGLDRDTYLQRPVAIMINNISVAQPVQAGLTNADVIYETEVEGGITRLLAVFKDIKSINQIGTVRSARYAYLDLAAGHNAIYVHHGQDEAYAAPHFAVVDRIVLDTNTGGQRVSNGLATEHTLYAIGSKLWSSIVEKFDEDTIDSEPADWLNFADESAPVTFDYTTDTVKVPFSASYNSIFKYNAETGKYTCYSGAAERKDINNSQAVTVKNVFVLSTTIGYYSDNYHRNISLTSGDGYYFTNGTYTKIKWTKGNASDNFKFKTEDGTALTVNTGNSWICIADKNKSQPIIGE